MQFVWLGLQFQWLIIFLKWPAEGADIQELQYPPEKIKNKKISAVLYPPWLFLQSNEAILLRLRTPDLNISDSQSTSLKRSQTASVFSAPLMSTVSAASLFLLCSLCSVLIRVLDNESWTVGGTFAAQLTPTSGQSRGENELGSGWIKHVSQDVVLFHRFPGAQSLLVLVDPLCNQSGSTSSQHKHTEVEVGRD